MVSVLICVICGVQFTKERTAGRKPLACSPSCAREHARRKAKQWYEAKKTLEERPLSLTPEYKAANWQQYYSRYRARHIQRVLQYAREHPSQKRARDAARYALTRGATEAERFTLEYVYERDGGKCHLCHKKVARPQATVDHLIPVALGGSHTKANVKLAHRSCNSSKKTAARDEQLLLLG